MLLVAPDIPGMESRKPLLQGFGCRLVGGGALSCEALYVHTDIPDQVLDARLYSDNEAPPREVRLAWSLIPPGLYRNASIDVEVD